MYQKETIYYDAVDIFGKKEQFFYCSCEKKLCNFFFVLVVVFVAGLLFTLAKDSTQVP